MAVLRLAFWHTSVLFGILDALVGAHVTVWICSLFLIILSSLQSFLAWLFYLVLSIGSGLFVTFLCTVQDMLAPSDCFENSLIKTFNHQCIECGPRDSFQAQLEIVADFIADVLTLKGSGWPVFMTPDSWGPTFITVVVYIKAASYIGNWRAYGYCLHKGKVLPSERPEVVATTFKTKERVMEDRAVEEDNALYYPDKALLMKTYLNDARDKRGSCCSISKLITIAKGHIEKGEEAAGTTLV